MPRLSPQEIARKAAMRASAATPDYVRSVRDVTVAPGARAAAKVREYVANVTANSGKWQRRVGAVTLEEWKATTEAKSSRFASGVQAAEGKIAAFWTKFGPVLDTASAKVRAMPSGTFEERKARAIALMDELHKYTG